MHWCKREHTFAEESFTDIDAVKTAYKFITAPHLDTGGKSLTMHLGISLDHVWSEPGAILLIAVLGGGTAAYNAIKVTINGKFIFLSAKELTHGVADVDFTRKDDKALQGTEPLRLRLVAVRVPGEETIGIGQQQTIDGEIAADGYQSVVFTQMGIGKPEVIV